MSKRTFPVDYSQQIAIVQAMRRAFEKVKHHQQFTKRIKPAFEAELPGYTVYVNPAYLNGNGGEIAVWGNGVSYDDAVRVTWPKGLDGKELTWQEGFAYGIDRTDPSDYAEWQEHERAILPALEGYNRAVEDIRAKAAAMLADIPTPKAAKLRSDRAFWGHASYPLQDLFPLLFKGD
jgi:hypothetical protein